MSLTEGLPIRLPVMARVEGEGALSLEREGGRITGLKLSIFEPPRFFEKLLEGRHYLEVPDMVARICGLCPVAYQMSAVQALEGILGLSMGPWQQAMRRLFYCGEWIESHCAHLHLLAAPDFFACGNVIELSKRAPHAVSRGLRLQGLGNRILRFLGGRSVHPVGARVGGFWQAPRQQDAQSLADELAQALAEAEALLDWVAGWPIPDVEQSFESVALRHDHEYPMNAGRIVSDHGLDIPASAFEQHFSEHQVPYSTALHCLHRGQPYLVGPLARMNLNHDRLPGRIAHALQRTGIQFPSRNPYHSAVVRAVEVLLAMHEAVALLQAYQPVEAPYLESNPRPGIGYGATEAPRGLLWHRYELDAEGAVRTARIVPPTAQNQARIEADLMATLNQMAQADEAQLRFAAERAIRNYDPCISCATHFLRLDIRQR